MLPILSFFRKADIALADTTVSVRVAGSGPGLLLLHGFPQTGAMWHRVAPALSADYTVVVPELRGAGAAQQFELMDALGLETFTVVGHDRGARVGWRMAQAQPQRIEQLALLDAVPTPVPVLLDDSASVHSIPARNEYLEASQVEVEDDEPNDATIICPTLVLWGEYSDVGKQYDVLAEWQSRATEVTGEALPAGHFLAEEAPVETYAALRRFLRVQGTGMPGRHDKAPPVPTA